MRASASASLSVPIFRIAVRRVCARWTLWRWIRFSFGLVAALAGGALPSSDCMRKKMLKQSAKAAATAIATVAVSRRDPLFVGRSSRVDPIRAARSHSWLVSAKVVSRMSSRRAARALPRVRPRGSHDPLRRSRVSPQSRAVSPQSRAVSPRLRTVRPRCRVLAPRRCCRMRPRSNTDPRRAHTRRTRVHR